MKKNSCAQHKNSKRKIVAIKNSENIHVSKKKKKTLFTTLVEYLSLHTDILGQF